MAKIKTTQVSATFGTGVGGGSIQLEDDQDYLGSYEGFYFKVIASSPDYQLLHDFGDIKKIQKDATEVIEETIAIPREKSAQLSSVPLDGVQVVWSNLPSNFTLNQDTISFPNLQIGSMKVKYTRKFDRYNFDFLASEKQDGGPPQAVIVGTLGDDQDHLVYENMGYKGITIRIVDACTGDPVNQATVTVDGMNELVTDADGKVELNAKLGEHSLFVTAEGYINSDEDSLDNDSFMVKEDEDEDTQSGDSSTDDDSDSPFDWY